MSPVRAHGSAVESAFEEALLESLRHKLHELVPQLQQSGTTLPEPEELAEAMVAAIPCQTTRSEYDALLGPFHSSAGVMRLLDIPTKQALADRRARGTLLAARTSDDVWVYPAFQFDVKARAVHRYLVPVLAALKAAPRWGAALWLVTAHDDLRGRAPYDVAAGSESEREFVCALAAQYTQAVSA